MIGYVENALNAFSSEKPKKAQSIPASLFWRSEQLGIYRSKNSNEIAKDFNASSMEYMPFNLFISEEHKLSFKVGDHPLQEGSVVSDHVKKELREVTIKGMFTNHPMKKLEETEEIEFKSDFATSNVKTTLKNSALEKFEELKKLANKRMPVRLVCSLEVYPKMIITNIDYDRDEKSGSSIRFTMTLREIKIVRLKSTKSDYMFSASEMNTAIAKLTAAELKNGKRSADEQDVEDVAAMAKNIEPEVL